MSDRALAGVPTDLTVADRLLLIREANGLTQHEMAKVVGRRHRNSWRHLESGRSQPSVPVLTRLALLGWSVSWILACRGPEHFLGPTSAPRLVEGLRQW